MSYGRMKEEEERLEAEVRELLRRAAEVDEEEDRRYGKDKRGDELPQELAYREGRLNKIREAKEALEAEAKREAEEAKEKGKERSGVPEEKAQRNFTDPESRIMPAPGGNEFVQAYNAQVAVDSAHQVIVACDITNEATDRKQARPMIEQVRENTGRVPGQISADAGYFSSKTLEAMEELKVEAFIPPDKVKHGALVPAAPRGRIPKGMGVVEQMRRKIRTKRGKRCYATRMKTVEPVFGQIKQCRGFRRFLLRGREKVRGEWGLICIGHNLTKLFNAKRQELVSQNIGELAIARG